MKATNQRYQSLEHQKPLLTPGVAKRLLGVHADTLRRLRKERLIPYVEICPGTYRYRLEDIQTYIKARLMSSVRHY